MMDVPLLTTGILHYAAVAHGETQVVSRCIDGSIYRYSYSEAHALQTRFVRAGCRRCHLRNDVADDGSGKIRKAELRDAIAAGAYGPLALPEVSIGGTGN